MKKMIFPILTDFELKLPYYFVGVGCFYSQEHIIRSNGFHYYQWIQSRTGSGKLIINNKTYLINENQGMLLFPNEPHEYYALSNIWEVDWIIFQGPYIETFFKHTMGIEKSGVYYLTYPYTIANKIVSLYEIENSDSPTKSIESSRLIYEILLDILRFSSERYDTSLSEQYSKLKPIINYIDQNYYKTISLVELSQMVDVTPQYLCNLFKKITSHTITEYINLTRIKKSKELMFQKNDLKIKEIALSVGFNDISYFCSIFKKLENVSPNEFKHMHSNPFK